MTRFYAHSDGQVYVVYVLSPDDTEREVEIMYGNGMRQRVASINLFATMRGAQLALEARTKTAANNMVKSRQNGGPDIIK